MIKDKRDGEDKVYAANDRGTGSPDIESIRMDGKTGKVSLPAGFKTSTPFQDCWDKPAADGSAAATTAEHTFFRAPGPMKITAVQYVPDAALTSNDTTYATITVKVRNADGTNAQTVASVTTQTTGGGGSGDWTQWVAVALALTVANATLAAGQILTVSIAKASTGVVVPAGELVITYQLL